MDDVLGHVVFAMGDEDLRPKILYVPSGCRSARVRSRIKIGAGFGFGEIHGRRPRAGNHLSR